MGWKLVRDGSEEWAAAHGVSGQWRTCATPGASLCKKIFGEAGEYAEEMDPGKLYDLREVVDRLIELVDPDYLAGARHAEKVVRLGSFSNLIEWTPVPAGVEDEVLRVTPRCGRPMHPYEGVWGALLDGVVCGRPAGHNPPCRSVQAMDATREHDRARWPGVREKRRARREFARLSLRDQLIEVVRAAASQARRRAVTRQEGQ